MRYNPRKKKRFIPPAEYFKRYEEPEWEIFRQQILTYAGHRCQVCGEKSENATICVHHSYYLLGREPWEHPIGSLIAVCFHTCHPICDRLRKGEVFPSLEDQIELEHIQRINRVATPEQAKEHFRRMREALGKGS